MHGRRYRQQYDVDVTSSWFSGRYSGVTTMRPAQLNTRHELSYSLADGVAHSAKLRFKLSSAVSGRQLSATSYQLER